MKQFTISCAVLFLVILALAGCAASSSQGPTAWLDQPLDRAKLPLEPQELTAHASDADGVASLEFYVNGALLVRSPAAGEMLADATVGWNPTRPGVYTIAARATDSQGNTGPDSVVIVTVGEVEGSPTPSLAVPPTEEIVTQETPSPRPPSSPTPTGTTRPPTPRPTSAQPTPTPVPPTSTPRPPTATPSPRRAEIAYFEANPGTINAGGCSTIRWGVDYAVAVYLDGEGVVGYDERQVCPPTTTTYTLFATAGGGDETRSVTVTVIEAPTPTPTPMVDTTKPDISDITLSATNISNTIGCSSPPDTTTISARVWDESGVWAVIASLQLAGSPTGTVVMSQSSPDVYQVELGPFTQIGDLVITIMAQDYHANTAQAVRTVTVSGMCVE